MNNLNAIPADPKLIEAVVLTCLEKNPIDFQKVDEDEVRRVVAAIKRATMPKGAALKYTVTRKHFLCGCLDFTGYAQRFIRAKTKLPGYSLHPPT